VPLKGKHLLTTLFFPVSVLETINFVYSNGKKRWVFKPPPREKRTKIKKENKRFVHSIEMTWTKKNTAKIK
jgi:hypothetical protein